MRRSVWQTKAAGRAKVRNQALRRARFAKNDLGRLQQCLEAGTDIHWLCTQYARRGSYPLSLQQLRDRIIACVKLEVRTARQAHQTWRLYRNLHRRFSRESQ